MTQVTCITCARFDFRGCPLARNGFGLCAIGPRYAYNSAVYPRECASHKPAELKVIEQRREWLAAQGKHAAHRTPTPEGADSVGPGNAAAAGG